MKIKFYEFFGFLRSWSPFPFFDGIYGGFYQHGTATNHLSELHFSVGRNYGFHPDGSPDLHFVGQLWIHGNHFGDYLPRRFWLFLCTRKDWGEDDRSQGKHQDGCTIGSHRGLVHRS